VEIRQDPKSPNWPRPIPGPFSCSRQRPPANPRCPLVFKSGQFSDFPALHDIGWLPFIHLGPRVPSDWTLDHFCGPANSARNHRPQLLYLATTVLPMASRSVFSSSVFSSLHSCASNDRPFYKTAPVRCRAHQFIFDFSGPVMLRCIVGEHGVEIHLNSR
jgi:hypothetical protein